MRTFELKVKIRSLSVECTIIRETEDRLKRQARKARRRQVDAAVDRLVASFWSLRKHRDGVREEVRATQLAIAFLRKMPYSQVEQIARWAAPFSRAEAIAQDFGEDRFNAAEWRAWELAARAHASTFPVILREREQRKQAAAVARNEARKVRDLAATG